MAIIHGDVIIVRRIIGILGLIVVVIGGVFGIGAAVELTSEQPWQQVCDGIAITSNCTAEDGSRYAKYVYHGAEPEVTKEIHHPAEPAKTHTLHHEAVYSTRTVPNGCIKTTISYKSGSCALSQCRDGEYSGSAGRGTCSHHGGVLRTGGPWYTYREEVYLVRPAWDETIVDVPAKDAWTETIIVSPAKEAYIEKVLADV